MEGVRTDGGVPRTCVYTQMHTHVGRAPSVTAEKSKGLLVEQNPPNPNVPTPQTRNQSKRTG